MAYSPVKHGFLRVSFLFMIYSSSLVMISREYFLSILIIVVYVVAIIIYIIASPSKGSTVPGVILSAFSLTFTFLGILAESLGAPLTLVATMDGIATFFNIFALIAMASTWVSTTGEVVGNFFAMVLTGVAFAGNLTNFISIITKIRRESVVNY